VSLRFEEAFFQDAELHDRLFDLIEHLHPGIVERLSVMRLLGHEWARISRPFALFEGKTAIAHVGVVGLPLVYGGSPVTVGCLHAAVTHPEHRRRGHFRALADKALDWCDANFPATVAFTAEGALVEPLGFRKVPEHLFRASVEPPPRFQGFQKLDWDRSLHVATVRNLLAERRPLATRCGISDPDGGLFAMNVALRDGDLASVRHCRELGILALYGIERSTLRLHDLVVKDPPPLSEIVRQIGRSIHEVEVRFVPPDSWGDAFEAVPVELEGRAMWLRGPERTDDRPILVPATARCW
jgi:GNAT superfamily N-acetyltransferase